MVTDNVNIAVQILTNAAVVKLVTPLLITLLQKKLSQKTHLIKIETSGVFISPFIPLLIHFSNGMLFVLVMTDFLWDDMDFIPTISNILLYFFSALIVVVLISFVYFKLVKTKDDEQQLPVNEKREYMKQYIINQRKNLAVSPVTSSQQLNYRIYSAPTYSDIQTSSRKIEVKFGRPILNNSRQAMHQRYTIINYSTNTDLDKSGTSSSRCAYSPFREIHHYKY